jgi:uncharacterized protein
MPAGEIRRIVIGWPPAPFPCVRGADPMIMPEQEPGRVRARPLTATVRLRSCHRLRVMAIHPDLLEILACPVCKTPVELVKEGAGLRCAQCRRVYPVRDDIPIMLPEEAEQGA